MARSVCRIVFPARRAKPDGRKVESLFFVNSGPHRTIPSLAAPLLALLSTTLLCIPGRAQAPILPPRHAPPTNVTVDGSEAMFTTMCALHAAGFEQDVSTAGWHPLRARLREQLLQQRGPAVEALRQFYKEHELADPGDTLSRYVWFGLVSGPAPQFKPIVRRDELPPDVIALEGFGDILADYYKEQKIGQLWKQVQPAYDKEIARLHDAISRIVFVANGYLREIQNSADPRTFAIVVEPMVGRITNVRNSGDRYAIILSGSQDVPLDVVRHAYLHFLLDPLPLRYSHVVAAKRPLLDYAARAPRLPVELRDEFSAFFAECLVRAVELRLKRASPGERDAALQLADADGYVLERPLFAMLASFEKSEPSMTLYFPDLVRPIDTSAEMKRLDRVTFAAADPAPDSNDPSKREITRIRRNLPGTVPNDPDALTALNEGEKQIAEKNPRAAEAAFQKVLARYPEQARARYGLGLVAMLEGDPAKAQEVFGRLVNGEHAATNDPMVLAWSHVYLGRIYEGNGQRDRAKQEFQAALDVPNGPEPARLAAQRGLQAPGGSRKASEHP
ncbi:MAG: hypothetical protein AUG07_02675 [Acidobacteria bacterium 13_1_20CM_2_60_10]|nr:MAG: hypothetical protein AUG07_02675 [Acidobacteria bacterium 13_1_20CM_2_60_10]